MKPTKFAIPVILVGLGLIFTGVVISRGTTTSTWVQSSSSGFGDPSNAGIFALSPFEDHLYAGTFGNVAEIWRQGSNGWSSVMDDGFGNSDNLAIVDLVEFDNALYAGTVNGVDGGQIWRSSDGNTWEEIISDGFGLPTNVEIIRFGELGADLYASTWSYTTTHGTELWRSSSGDALDWTRVVTSGFDGDANNEAVMSLEVYSDTLFAGTWNRTTGGEVWASSDGLSWKQVNADGFGTVNNEVISALAAFKGMLYASTRTAGSGVGNEVWRCQLCDSSDWSKVVDNGFGNVETDSNSALEVLSDYLYFAVGNMSTGIEVWRSLDGSSATWKQVAFEGFGDSNNIAPYYDNSVTVSGSSLYVGTVNFADGGEVWLYLSNEVYLPIVLR